MARRRKDARTGLKVGDRVTIEFEIAGIDSQKSGGNILRLQTVYESVNPSGRAYRPTFVLPTFVVRDDVLNDDHQQDMD